MNTGWIKLHRRIAECQYWLEDPFTRGQAWVDMLLKANHQPGFVRVQGMRIDISRGELGISEVSLSERWKWSRGKVRRFLDELQHDGMIFKKTHEKQDRRKSIITIVNYDKYQNLNTANDTGDGQAAVQASVLASVLATIQEQEEKNGNIFSCAKTQKKSVNSGKKFDGFWEIYPKKKSKVDAQKAWKQIGGDSKFEAIMDGLRSALHDTQWLQEGGRFIPYPASWLRAGGYLDEQTSPTTTGQACTACRHNLQGICNQQGTVCGDWAGRI